MYTNAIVTDLWSGVRCEESSIMNPSWEDIEIAIKRLDGKHRTIVTIKGEEEAHLTVGGGAGGQYVVYATFDNANYFTLMSNDQSQSKVMLFVGGQEGDYPKNIVVDLHPALAAARTFAEIGQIDRDLAWRNE